MFGYRVGTGGEGQVREDRRGRTPGGRHKGVRSNISVIEVGQQAVVL
jgi:hypothetical protein